MRLPLFALLLSCCLSATGCLVLPGICGPYVAWYPGMHAGEPEIGGGDGSSFAKAIVIKNWPSWNWVKDLELSQAKAVATGSVQSEETIRKNGRLYHALTVAEKNAALKHTIYFDVTDAVKPAK